MKSTVYKFDEKWGILDNKFYVVRDYFQYYTTGIEHIANQYPESLMMTSRENAERPEQIMYGIFKNADLADLFVALNNQNYLWSTPFELDAFQDAIEFRMSYLESLMRDRIEYVEVFDANGNQVFDEHGKPILELNEVGKLCYERIEQDIHDADDQARTVIIPHIDRVSFIMRKVKDYFKARAVK